MAQTYNFSGDTLVIPGSYIKTTVLNGTSGLATAGVIALVGEADSGPAYDELKVSKVNGASILVDGGGNRVAFTPDELSLVQGMFGGGRLVEAFKALSAPFAAGGTNAIAGTPALVYVIKTNQDGAAKASIGLEDSLTALATIKAKNYGTYGNLITAECVEGDADVTTGLKPITLKIQSGPTSESFVFNKKSPLKVVGNYALHVTATTAQIDSETPVKLADCPTYVQLAAKLGGPAKVVVNSGFEALSPSVVKMDIGTFTGPVKYVPCSGYELSQISSALIDIADLTYAALAANPDMLLDGESGKQSLALGALGSTQNTDVTDALAVLENVNLNFVVPLFSQDAADDIADGETGEDSTYTLNHVVQATLDHVGRMSAVKLKKNRQAFLSHEGTYADLKTLMNDPAVLLQTPYQYRASMAFQGVKALDLSGAVKDFQPWMLSVLAASAQSVAGYRPIFNKGLNVLGFTNPTGYDGKIPAQEDALKSGLLVLADASNGIDTILLSDQTSYLLPDNNFVYNSVQAVYGADIIALTIQQQMQVFVGQSTGDVSAPIALSYLQSIMANLLNQRWIASSSDAPNGYKNAKVNIAAPVMAVSVEAKESSGIYFVPINLTISGVTSAA